MKRVKVLHVITHVGVGGATDNTIMTVAGLPRDRYEVDLAAGVLTPGDNYTEWRGRAEESADAAFFLSDLVRDASPLRDLKATRTLTTLIREGGYDIVHTHCSKAGFLGRIAARRAEAPIIVHTCHAFAWQVAHSRATSLPRRAFSAAAREALLALDRYAASLSDALITVSDINREMAIAAGLSQREKFTTIYSGIDLRNGDGVPGRAELCRRHGLDPDRPVVGTVGRLASQKDPVMFVRAAKLVLRRRPDAQFIMLGDGPLESQVREAIGGEPAIRMLGHRDDVREILTILDAFVLSSRWEGLGRALTEAVGAGVPVAATEVDGIPELVTHNVTGRLSPPGDPDGLAQSIIWILEHRNEALRMAAEGRTRVVREWGADQMVSQIDALYQRLLAGRGSGNGSSSRPSNSTPTSKLQGTAAIGGPEHAEGDRGLRSRRVSRSLARGGAALTVLGCHLLTACGSSSMRLPPPVVAQERPLQAGDILRIDVWRQPEYSGEFVIGPGGGLVHPLYQEIALAGLSIPAARHRISEFLSGYLQTAQLVVEPLYSVSVAGEVSQPSVYHVLPGTTVAQAIAMAGGPTTQARFDEVLIVRDGERFQLELGEELTSFGSISVVSGDQVLVDERSDFSVWRDVIIPVGTIATLVLTIVRIGDLTGS